MSVEGYRLASYNADFADARWVIHYADSGAIRKYDYETSEWVADNDLYGIFVGSPETIRLTEDEARRVIEDHGGTWKPVDA